MSDKQTNIFETIDDPAVLTELCRLALLCGEQGSLKLSPREKKLLELRSGAVGGVMHSREQLAEQFGVTLERLRQIEKKLLRKMVYEPQADPISHKSFSADSRKTSTERKPEVQAGGEGKA